MRIGGFVKQSLIDWEGKISAVVFTKGCNLRCGYCHNHDLVYPSIYEQIDDFPEGDILEYLSCRTHWLDGVVISGGEPTLQKDLKNFTAEIKKMGYAVKIDTNGLLPEVLDDLLNNKMVDYVAMDIKTVLNRNEYERICGVKDNQLINKVERSLKILKKSGIEYQIRTTVVPMYHSSDIVEGLQKSFSYCNYKLQEYRGGETIRKSM